MQPTISIPQHWGYPRFALDRRTQQGLILGLYHYPSGTELAEQFGDGWRESGCNFRMLTAQVYFILARLMNW
ncbi:hypothetical protein [Nostoc sp. CALU 1950]|uniref:hypothetical protein n=1 Tax=Nostoc sp. CALU 1950 TaxID=3104321 RepID=UPI003EB75EDE